MKMICISTYYRSSVGGSQREGRFWRGGTCLPRTTREDLNITRAPNKWIKCDGWEQGEDVTSYRADRKVNSRETSPSRTTSAIGGTNGSAGPMGSPVCEANCHCSDKSLRFVDTHSTSLLSGEETWGYLSTGWQYGDRPKKWCYLGTSRNQKMEDLHQADMMKWEPSNTTEEAVCFSQKSNYYINRAHYFTEVEELSNSRSILKEVSSLI